MSIFKNKQILGPGTDGSAANGDSNQEGPKNGGSGEKSQKKKSKEREDSSVPVVHNKYKNYAQMRKIVW